ncbi:hypothetical protein CHARACLAT_009495, partial [Characodon lateralis]|nr:hypothetical protein [Characodon lateralis]
MNSSECIYFIITEKPKTPSHIEPGSICYIREYRYRSEVSTPSSLKQLSVEFLDSRYSLPYDICKACMQKLNADEADLLLACQPESDRLNLFRNTDAVQSALTLTVGTEVMVEEDGEKLRGIIRYIGPMNHPNYSHPITGRYFGIELQGADKGKGSTNGTFSSKKCFSCEKNCGVFAPFSRVRPVVPTSHSPSMSTHHTQQQTEGIIPGDSVVFFINDEFRFGMVVDIQEEAGTPMVRIST